MNGFRCNDCDTLFDDAEIGSELFCPICSGHLVEEAANESKKTDNYANHNKQKKSGPKRQKQDTFIFNCLSCDKSIRIVFPFKSLRFRCANCGNKYDIHSTSSNREVYLVVPHLDRNTSSKEQPRKATMPAEVKIAFRVFELDETASLRVLKTAYRKSMSEYHPDKVSHLGVDLKTFAEEKTKEYNTAFDIIQKYFDH